MKLGVLEGLLFIMGEDGATKEEIKKILEIEDDQVFNNLIEELKNELSSEKRGLRLTCLGNKYKLTTKEEHKEYYELLANKTINQTLSQSALETLAIIAYNNPISVGQIDEIRGVASRDMVRKLLFKGLIEIKGKSDLPGKPFVYGITDKFLDYFNLSSIEELPKIDFDEEVEDDDEKDLFGTRYNENIN